MSSTLHGSSSDRRLLLLAPFPPGLNKAHGGARAVAHLLGGLASHYRVALLYPRGSDQQPLDEALRARCEIVEEVRCKERRPVDRLLQRSRIAVGILAGRPKWVTDLSMPAFTDRVRTVVGRWNPDIVQFEYSVMAQYAPALGRCPAPRIMTIYEPAAEAAGERLQCSAPLASIRQWLKARAWRRYERAMFRLVDTAVVFTERDRRAIVRLAGRTPIRRIPLGVDLPSVPLDPLGKPPLTLLFVGSFTHPPNADAARRLVTRIFPLVRARVAGSTLCIVGPQPPVDLRRMAGSDVVVTGEVPDVTPYLDQAAVVVVPLRAGGGMRVKVLEALASGKAVVASALAVEGIAVTDDIEFALAGTDEEFASRIVDLLTDAERRLALARRARTWASRTLGSADSVEGYRALYDELLFQSRRSQASTSTVMAQSTAPPAKPRSTQGRAAV